MTNRDNGSPADNNNNNNNNDNNVNNNNNNNKIAVFHSNLHKK